MSLISTSPYKHAVLHPHTAHSGHFLIFYAEIIRQKTEYILCKPNICGVLKRLSDKTSYLKISLWSLGTLDGLYSLCYDHFISQKTDNESFHKLQS